MNQGLNGDIKRSIGLVGRPKSGNDGRGRLLDGQRRRRGRLGSVQEK